MARGDQYPVVYVDGDVPQQPIQLGQLLVDSSQISPGTTNLQQCTSQNPLTYEGIRPFFPISPAEVAVGATIVAYYYAPGNVLRYGAVGDGVANDSPPFQTAIDVCKYAGGVVLVPAPLVTFRLAAPLNLTSAGAAAQPGFTVQGAAGASVEVASITLDHNGHGFDCTGAAGITFSGLSIDTAQTAATCFFLARNNLGSSQRHRFTNVRVFGSFQYGVLYNYGSEETVYVGCWWWNTNTANNTKVAVFTSENIFSLTTDFPLSVTIATGPQSCIDHQFFGGQFLNTAGQNASDIFYFDGIRGFKMYASWMFNASASTDGRALFYVDLTNASSDLIKLNDVQGEASAGANTAYGILFSNTARTVTQWGVNGCQLNCNTNALSAPASVTLDNWCVSDVYEANNRGFAISGTLQHSTLNTGALTLSIASSVKNVLVGYVSQWTITSTRDDWTDVGTTTNSWTPSTTNLTVVGGISTNRATYTLNGQLVVFNIVLSAGTSIACAAGTLIPTLPFATIGDVSAQVAVWDVAGNAPLGTGYVNGSGIYLPAIAATQTIAISGSYFRTT